MIDSFSTLTFRRLRELATLILSLMAITASTAQAGYVVVNDRPNLPANDLIDWTVLGPSGTVLSNPFAVASTGGKNVSWSQNSGTPQRLDQGSGWDGNFPNFGDSLLFTGGFEGGPVTLDFGGLSVSSIGFGIQANFYGPYDGYLELLDASDLVLHTVNFSGLSSTDPVDYRFIGVYSDDPMTDFAKARFNVTLPQLTTGDFAIDSVSFTAVPEPATWISMGVGSLLVAGYRTRQRRRANA
jgi:hypothetical protein